MRSLSKINRWSTTDLKETPRDVWNKFLVQSNVSFYADQMCHTNPSMESAA